MVITLDKQLFDLNEKFVIRINYSTTKESECVQWLNSNQTNLKQYPFMFTNSEPILGRCLIPCQVKQIKINNFYKFNRIHHPQKQQYL